MTKLFENLKGTYDYLPDKQILRENIKETLQKIFIKYGFAPVETPILCPYDLLASKYSEGADILNEMYTLSDQGDRNLGLRYDLTITFSKLISSNPYMSMPFKRYEIGKVFRDGPVKLGRNREFTQCDIDMVGVTSLMAEAEYMTMTEEAYRSLGLDVEILFNNRKLLSGIIMALLGENISTQCLRKCIMLIDKLEKLSEADLYNEFAAIDVGLETVDKIKKVFELSFPELKEMILKYPQNNLITEGLMEVEELYGYVSGTIVEERMCFAPYLARGIDIYTGTVWEVFLKNRVIDSVEFNMSIGGGGRYDKIITNFIGDGKEYPAVGMSFGLDVIYEILNIKNKNKQDSFIELYVIPIDTQKEAFKLVTELRNCGITVEIEKNNQKVKKSMNYANKMNIPYVIVLGENEIKTRTVNVKRMNDGKIFQCNLDEIWGITQIIENSYK